MNVALFYVYTHKPVALIKNGKKERKVDCVFVYCYIHNKL